MSLTFVGDINPADLAQAGSERARARIIAQGGKRSRFDNPTYGWRHGEQALPWWLARLNGDAVNGARSRRRGGSDVYTDNAAVAGTGSPEVAAIDLERAVRRAVDLGDLDESLASRVLAGVVTVSPGVVRAVTPVAVGFVPLVLPFLLKAGASAAAGHMVNRALTKALPPAGTTVVSVTPPEPEDDVGRTAMVGVASPPTVGVENYRGDFWDLIDTDGFRVRL